MPAKFTQLEQLSQPDGCSDLSNFINQQPEYENQRSNNINKSAVELNDYTELTVKGTDWIQNEYEQLKESQADASSGSSNFNNQQPNYKYQRSNEIHKPAVEPNYYTTLTVEGTDLIQNEYKQLNK